MDSLPPPPPPPPPYVYAASDSRPRQAREIELCSRASSTDWVYLAGLGAGVVGTIALDVGFNPFNRGEVNEDTWALQFSLGTL